VEETEQVAEEAISIPEDSRSIIDTKPDDRAPEEEPEEEEIEVSNGRNLRIGRALEGELREELITFLKKNVSVFAWTTDEMPGINKDVAEHKLLIKAGSRPVRQKKRRMGLERHMAVRQEVEKLLKAAFIREATCPEWDG
jgi:hypothetical protein